MNVSLQRVVMWLVVPGLIGAAIIIALVLATGQTFGQRCAVEHEWGSPDWDDCVTRLANTEERI